jgi:hypothetical protein
MRPALSTLPRIADPAEACDAISDRLVICSAGSSQAAAQ